MKTLAKLSLLEQYVAVTAIPSELSSFLRKMKSSNSRSILSFLLDNLPTVKLGDRYHRERIIRLVEPMRWEISHGYVFRLDVPSFSADSAITASNAWLKERLLPYRVGRKCHNGDPRHPSFQQVAPYMIGLVDINRPLELESKPKLLSGSRAV